VASDGEEAQGDDELFVMDAAGGARGRFIVQRSVGTHLVVFTCKVCFDSTSDKDIAPNSNDATPYAPDSVYAAETLHVYAQAGKLKEGISDVCLNLPLKLYSSFFLNFL
jgi:hypothetical protein